MNEFIAERNVAGYLAHNGTKRKQYPDLEKLLQDLTTYTLSKNITNYSLILRLAKDFEVVFNVPEKSKTNG